ncbi:hypothetical protein AB6A40_008609 [Gnathostoma spinigerum]|uniref:Uncharacterized protein n=1 Tax=Gnathostoma spinigerum TaxID=75299 RepID=A0ABD6EZW8_9BILA
MSLTLSRSALVPLLLTIWFSNGYRVKRESCTDKFCPPGTFCDYIDAPCSKPPCRKLVACLPNKLNGCDGHPKCPPGEVCIEHIIPCISRSCKKEAKCVKEGS